MWHDRLYVMLPIFCVSCSVSWNIFFCMSCCMYCRVSCWVYLHLYLHVNSHIHFHLHLHLQKDFLLILPFGFNIHKLNTIGTSSGPKQLWFFFVFIYFKLISTTSRLALIVWINLCSDLYLPLTQEWDNLQFCLVHLISAKL